MTKKQRGPFTVVLLLLVNTEHTSSEFFVVFCFFFSLHLFQRYVFYLLLVLPRPRHHSAVNLLSDFYTIMMATAKPYI